MALGKLHQNHSDYYLQLFREIQNI